MADNDSHENWIAAYKTLLLGMPLERTVTGVLHLAVQSLAALPQTALVRIWLLNPADICAVCPLSGECPREDNCLHLTASAGNPIKSPGEDWSRLDGEFSRVPVGVRKVGKIAATGQPIEVLDILKNSKWIAHPGWALRENIRCFLGQPLICKGETLGVLALFTRRNARREEAQWLRMVADHAAMSIVNARAFEEISRLRRQLELESEFLRQEIIDAKAMGEIVGQSAALKNIIQKIDLVAPVDANVLILGESGTGKELVAREIHKRSKRQGRPLIKVNCASIPGNLFESEFFGHVKGAFTGALKDRAGRFEAADGGTLFLDEVGEIPVEMQGKLLRALQEGQFERVGEDRTRQVDVRIISATNRNLEKEIVEGRFRNDLFYRLNVFPIEVPALNQHKEDIPSLALLFLERASRKFDRPGLQLTQSDLLQLEDYDWPGNVRELQNIIERGVILSKGKRLDLVLGPSVDNYQATAPPTNEEPNNIMTEDEMRRLERQNLEAALKKCAGKIYGPEGAAQLLGLPPTTLAARIKKMEIKSMDEGTR